MAKPLGIIFWALSVACLAMGFGNYVKTVNKYSRKAAIVQTGWKTQTVSRFWVLGLLGYGGRERVWWFHLHANHEQVLAVIAFVIIVVCVLFLATNSKRA